MEAGASGYITKSERSKSIVEAVRAVALGESRWFVNVARTGFSDREMEVLTDMCRGFTQTEISDRLCIAVPTVKATLSGVRMKLGTSNAAETAALAVESGLVTL